MRNTHTYFGFRTPRPLSSRRSQLAMCRGDDVAGTPRHREIATTFPANRGRDRRRRACQIGPSNRHLDPTITGTLTANSRVHIGDAALVAQNSAPPSFPTRGSGMSLLSMHLKSRSRSLPIPNSPMSRQFRFVVLVVHVNRQVHVTRASRLSRYIGQSDQSGQ